MEDEKKWNEMKKEMKEMKEMKEKENEEEENEEWKEKEEVEEESEDTAMGSTGRLRIRDEIERDEKEINKIKN